MSERPLSKLTDRHQDLIRPWLTSKERTLDTVIPDNLSVDRIHLGMEALFFTLGQVERNGIRVKVLIGRMLVVAQRNPEVFKSKGHDSFEAYVKSVCKLTGLSRSNLWEGKRIIEAAPALPMSTYEQAGVTNLLFVAKFTDHTKRDFKKIVDMACVAKTRELKEWAVDRGYFGSAADVTTSTLEISGSKTQIDSIREMIEKYKPLVAAANGGGGTPSDADVIEAAFAEASTEWGYSGEEE